MIHQHSRRTQELSISLGGAGEGEVVNSSKLWSQLRKTPQSRGLCTPVPSIALAPERFQVMFEGVMEGMNE